LDRVRVPIGLDLGRTTHQEIAVAILAELVQLRASGELAAAAGRAAGGAAAQPAGPAPSAVTDPVCGMTVTVGPDGRPFEHDGETYYFCCAGCRAEFEKDPHGYARKESRC
ncbi:MAG TPA: YHS domain-containing protein, partial [Streptosporangiaceae bacterium]